MRDYAAEKMPAYITERNTMKRVGDKNKKRDADADKGEHEYDEQNRRRDEHMRNRATMSVKYLAHVSYTHALTTASVRRGKRPARRPARMSALKIRIIKKIQHSRPRARAKFPHSANMKCWYRSWCRLSLPTREWLPFLAIRTKTYRE